MTPDAFSPIDAELDARWRAAFGQPLPMLGAPDVARAILREHDASTAGNPALALGTERRGGARRRQAPAAP